MLHPLAERSVVQNSYLCCEYFKPAKAFLPSFVNVNLAIYRQMWEVTKCKFVVYLFTYLPVHFNTNILTFYSLHFQNRLPTLVLKHGKSSSIFYFASFQHHKTDLLCDNQCISPGQFIKTETEREGHSDVEKSASVACICRDPAALRLDCLICSVCSGRFTNPKCWYLTSCE